MATYRDILAQAKKEIRQATPEEVQGWLGQSTPPVLIDVREPDETEQGIIPGARVIPRGFLEMRIEDTAPRLDQPVVLYCAA
ncbi:MAG TPA: rhodanese-like domain-containing protein, partial [Candidatus Dormibacteraeota bacterium]|nr:rhodanese-like domain-containing protein [Candidatus Dormibacteraeota bacterium]